MPTNCKATTKDGQPCGGWAGASGYCFMHDPARGADRAIARRRGGLNRRAAHGGNPVNVPDQVRSLQDVLAVLDFALGEALVLENSIARGRLLVAMAGTFIEAIKIGEMEARISALEALYDKSK
jgi:hypothetical protein